MQRVVAVLEEIRDNQKEQLKHQAKALDLQHQQFAMLQKQYERAESIQNMSAKLVSGSRKLFAIILPIIIVLIAYLSWLLFRRY